MENFRIYNPTVVHFGRDVIKDLGDVLREHGKSVLLVYGRGSILQNGVYDRVMEQIRMAGVEVTEYPGIKPNPVISDVDAAAALGRQKDVDVVLAVGGGSVIDSAKAIAITIPVAFSGWKFVKGETRPKKALPVIAVLTVAATGTEMNSFAVIQNDRMRQKIGFGFPVMFPRHSFLDPAYTFSVSPVQTAYGISDLIAHAVENYFGRGEATLSDRFVYAIISEAMEYGPRLLDNPGDYELRAKIMYAATCALNGLTLYGRATADWAVHSAGHVISLLFDTPHGATLSIAYPAWLKLMKKRIPERITELGKALFGVDQAGETINRLEDFYRSIGCPVTLQEAGIMEDQRQEILEVMFLNEVSGGHHRLMKDEVAKMLSYMYGKK